jgi:hypothetical protein
MLNDPYWGRRVINEGQLEESLYFSPMFGSIAHHIGSMLLPNFKRIE